MNFKKALDTLRRQLLIEMKGKASSEEVKRLKGEIKLLENENLPENN